MNKKYLFNYRELDDCEKRILNNGIKNWKYIWKPRFKLKHWRFYIKYYIKRFFRKLK